MLEAPGAVGSAGVIVGEGPGGVGAVPASRPRSTPASRPHGGTASRISWRGRPASTSL